MSSPNFWDDKEKADEVLKSISDLKNLTQDINNLKEYSFIQFKLPAVHLFLCFHDDLKLIGYSS